VTHREVVITGLGASTPLGGDMDSTWRALLAGTSGTKLLEDEWAADLPVHIAARAAVEPSEMLPPARLRSLDRSQQFALIAAREAWTDAGEPEIEPERLGAVVSSGIGGLLTVLEQNDIMNTRGPRRVSPFTVPMIMSNGSSSTRERVPTRRSRPAPQAPKQWRTGST
jgi:3-oxoacyl-[acyl-carrier-protein] synthase II